METELLHDPPKRYAIISHRWGEESEEVLFTDIGDPERAQNKEMGYYKVHGACTQARRDALDYVWLDTCCVDRRNHVELTEVINSMYRWYRESTVCYAYLHDVSDPTEFTKSDWFTRGWTLQELIVPRFLRFFTKNWKFIGTREDLIVPIAQCTGISPNILRTGEIPPSVSISQKMVWMSKRETSKEEDRVYSMLGILGVSMVPIYGVGCAVAFEDLQYRLISRRSDQTLFAWYHTFIPPEDVVMADAHTAPGSAPIQAPASNPTPGPVPIQASVPNPTSDPVPVPAPVPVMGPAPSSAPNPTPDPAQAPAPAPIPPPSPVPMSDPASDPAPTTNPSSNSGPNPAPGSAEDDANTPPLNFTGLLSTSPSHYLTAYEIPERDFRKYYVDNIRDFGYRSQFSITNNMIRITIPMKHIAGRLWRGVLRCSFDPPGGDQIQRPIIIYLKEIQTPWKFARVHIAPEEDVDMGDGQTNVVVRGVSGSLERLKDADGYLHGFALRDIDIVGLWDQTTEYDPPKEAPSDPNAIPQPSEAVRVANLPRHPPGVKTINILVCGEPGVASGRVINFILDHTVLKPLTDYGRETMATSVIDVTLNARQLRILYVLGPRDPYIERKHYPATLRHTRQFAQLVQETGGIHLMVMCMVGSKPTPAVGSNYRLFYEGVCRAQVPMILIITGLGKARRMEDWWEENKRDPVVHPMAQCVLAHACITVLRGDDEDQAEKFRQSREMVQRLVYDYFKKIDAGEKEPYLPEDIEPWFVSLCKRATDLLLPSQRRTLERGTVKSILMESIQVSESEAEVLVPQIFDQP